MNFRIISHNSFYFIFINLLPLNDKIFAQNQINEIDVYGNIGYTLQNGFSFDKISKAFGNFSGYNLGVQGLYSIYQVDNMAAVIGGGLNYTNTTSKNGGNGVSYSESSTTFSSLSLTANGGLKFFPIKKLFLFTLVNLGYGISDYLDVSFTSDNSFINAAATKLDFEIKNHYFYGITLVGSYNITNSLSLGRSLVYNRHNIDLKYVARSESSEESSKFNEYSANIIAMWSF